MRSNRENLMITIVFILLMGVVIGAIGYGIHKDCTVIDTRVETISGQTYDCVEARSYDDGMTHIDKPYFVIIPTRSIKIIKRIK